MDEKRKKDNERIAIARAFLKAVEETDFEHHEPLDKVLAALPDMKVKEGFVVDYFFDGGFTGGGTIVYCRRMDDAPIESYDHYGKGEREFSRDEWDTALKACPDWLEALEMPMTEDGIWQTHLLVNVSKHVMPLFWHGLYARRQYLFTIRDYKALEDSITQKRPHYDIELCPEVEMVADGVFLVQDTYFNNWSGVMRGQYLYLTTNGKLITKDLLAKTQVEHECGICF